MATKTYYHVVPNSRVIRSDGKEFFFVGGQLTTDDPEIIKEMDKQIENGNTIIRHGVHATPDAAVVKTQASITSAAIAAATKLKEEAEKQLENKST